ncbi:MAG: 3-oxoacid CoA-transferase subunit B [Planctomycetota bacterium]|nr:3-oxoacid CoA-transferase subunit B [Planctomycetota bacterium]
MASEQVNPTPPQIGWSKTEMADTVIDLIQPGSSLNLGIGMPTMVIERMPAEKGVMIHSENGVLGVDGRPVPETVSPTLINAGKETIAVGKGASFFDSALSFGMIRGGHIDFCVLGGMEVDRHGSLANWMVPGKKVTGMGGAMDLVHGAKQVIVMLTHFSKAGKCKLVAECELPLTGERVVHQVVTERGLFSIENGQFKIERLAPGVSRDELGIDLQWLA